ncbi:MAG: GNAT family N-acetyltransferase [Actinomycetota bacterium]|nr:GNAT family N-acetyltransferase [Actinomycetota bacterium]
MPITAADASVRPARPADAPALGELQSRSWRLRYDGVLPSETLDTLEPERLAQAWASAVSSPPSGRHRVLVACAGADVVGFVASGPAEDSDLDAAVDAELHVFLVAPDRMSEGHGSRLLAALVDHLRTDGFTRAYTWLTSDDERVRGFLESTGWAPDGAHRSLDLRGDGTVVVNEVRLHTDVTGPAG